MRFIINLLVVVICFKVQASYSFESAANQAVLMDYETGEILYAKNADARVFPSSMTKIMTAYLIFEDLQSGKLKLTDKINITDGAWRQVGSRMFLNLGSKVSVNELLKGLIVQSGNDAAYVLAEGSMGTVNDFVARMNNKATELNLQNTNFTNPIGYSEDGHYMSVRDTAMLSRKLIECFPQYYKKYFSIVELKYNNILQQNRNALLKSYDGVDGIKTGHTEAGGYSLAASAYRDGRRLISVINGSLSEQSRSDESKKLLDYGFRTLNRYTLYKNGEIIGEIPVRYGREKFAKLVSNIDLLATAKNKEQIEVVIDMPKYLKAPIVKDQKVGTITLKTVADERTYLLYSEFEIKEVNVFEKIFLAIYYFIKDILD